MKVTQYLKQADGPLVTIEIIPPLKGVGIDSIYKSIDPLMEFKPIAINVTYHQEEYEFRKMPNGLHKRCSVRKRPGTVGISAALEYRYNVEAVPHLICGGFTKEETENALIDLNFLGINNILAIRGDPANDETSFTPEPDGNVYALDLIRQIADMNEGRYLYEELDNATQSDFCIGVAGYPEKHFEAPNMASDLKHLKQKVDAGADYIVTQMFFDNRMFFEYERRCREIGIEVPIIPGIKLLAVKTHLNILPSVFKVNIPEELSAEVEKCRDNKEVREVGIQWCIQQCKELIAHGVPCLHFYTMGKSYGTRKVLEALF